MEKEFDACKASAAGMLAFRPHTRSELTTKLTDKGYDKACIERSINRLQELVRPSLTQTLTAGCVPIERQRVTFQCTSERFCAEVQNTAYAACAPYPSMRQDI